MESFGKRLRQRASELGLTNNDVARAVGLEDRTFGHYVKGDRQPNLETLVRIARTMNTTTDWLLGVEEPSSKSEAAKLNSEITAIMKTMDASQLRIIKAVALTVAKEGSR